MNVLVDRRRRHPRQDPRHRPERRAARVRLGPHADGRGRWWSACKKLAEGWEYDAVSIGYPGPVVHNQARGGAAQSRQGLGRVRLSQRRSDCPVKIINDAAMQALGSYRGRQDAVPRPRHGLGTTMIVDGIVVPMELGAPAVQEGDVRGLCRRARARAAGKEDGGKHVADVVERLMRGARARRRRARRRQRREIEGAAAALPARRQRQRVPGRISAVGGPGQDGSTERPKPREAARPKSANEHAERTVSRPDPRGRRSRAPCHDARRHAASSSSPRIRSAASG